jgi:hypothetical protein
MVDQSFSPPPPVQPAPKQTTNPPASQNVSTSGKSWLKSRALWWSVGGILSLVLLFWLASSIVPRVLVYLTRATSRPGNFSLANSYVFASPLVVAANGEEKIRVNVFLLSDKGKGVPEKDVSLTLSPQGNQTGLPQILLVQPRTNNYGQAVFELVSNFAGQYTVEAQVSGVTLPQTVTVTFK